MIEWDSDVPSLEVLLEEASRVPSGSWTGFCVTRSRMLLQLQRTFAAHQR